MMMMMMWTPESHGVTTTTAFTFNGFFCFPYKKRVKGDEETYLTRDTCPVNEKNKDNRHASSIIGRGTLMI